MCACVFLAVSQPLRCIGLTFRKLVLRQDNNFTKTGQAVKRTLNNVQLGASHKYIQRNENSKQNIRIGVMLENDNFLLLSFFRLLPMCFPECLSVCLPSACLCVLPFIPLSVVLSVCMSVYLWRVSCQSACLCHYVLFTSRLRHFQLPQTDGTLLAPSSLSSSRHKDH